MAVQRAGGEKPSNRGIRWGLAGLITVLVVTGVLSYRNTRQLEEDARWVAHTQRVLGALADLRATSNAAIAVQRGYLLTGDEALFKQYLEVEGRTLAGIRKVETLTADNPREQERIPRLQALVTKRSAALARHAAIRRARGVQAAVPLVASGEVAAPQHALEGLLAAMDADEQALLRQRQRTNARSYLTSLVSGLAAALAGLIAVGMFIWLLRNYQRSQQRAAAAIQRERAVLEATLVSIGDGVISTDAEGRVTFLNRVAEQLTGWTPSEARGESLEEVFRIVNEQTRLPAQNPAKRALDEGKIVGLANHTVLIRKDGAEVPLDDSAAPIREGDAVSGAVLVFRDVTERRQAEARLAESEERLRATFEQAAVGIALLRPDGGWLRVNQKFCDIVGYTREEMAGMSFRDVTHPDDVEADLRQAGRLLAGEITTYTTENRYLRKDRSLVWVNVTVSLVRAPEGEPRYFIAVIEDVTLRKRAEDALREQEEQLREADRRKDEFLATVAHELRNPLAPIHTAVQLLRTTGPQDSQLQRLRDVIERQVNHMVRLVDDLLEVSRITRGKIALHAERVDLSRAVRNAVETSGPAVEAGRHELTVTTPEEPVIVEGDMVRLTQVVTNLLNNSAKFTPDGGQIRVTVECEDGRGVVRVRDSGPGIPPEMLTRVFDVFAQINSPVPRSQGGLGIGLAIAKRLVELHGGEIEARSDGSSGAEFIVRIPLARPVAESHAVTASPAGPEAPRPSFRILVVDDNVDAAESLSELLSLEGHEVRTAHDGRSGVEAAATFQPDLIFLDLGMPGMDGYEAARKIRELQPEGRKAKLVALTGWGQEEHRRRTREAGFDGHLVKPVPPGALEEVLATVRSG